MNSGTCSRESGRGGGLSESGGAKACSSQGGVPVSSTALLRFRQKLELELLAWWRPYVVRVAWEAMLLLCAVYDSAELEWLWRAVSPSESTTSVAGLVDRVKREMEVVCEERSNWVCPLKAAQWTYRLEPSRVDSRRGTPSELGTIDAVGLLVVAKGLYARVRVCE